MVFQLKNFAISPSQLRQDRRPAKGTSKKTSSGASVILSVNVFFHLWLWFLNYTSIHQRQSSSTRNVFLMFKKNSQFSFLLL